MKKVLDTMTNDKRDLFLDYSMQAETLIRILENQDPDIRAKISQWYVDNKMVVGGGHVLEYIEKTPGLQEYLLKNKYKPQRLGDYQ